MQREIESLKMSEKELKQQLTNLKEEILDLKSSNMV
jgi:ribosomal protein L29